MNLLDLKRLTGAHLTAYRRLAEEETIPESGGILLPPERFEAEREALAGRQEPVGLVVASNTPVETLAPMLDDVPLVAIELEKFSDGRVFSLAWRLRRQQGYTGEIRAVGRVLADHAEFLLRSGVDSVEVDDPRALESIAKRLQTYSVWYQDAVDARPTVPELRHGRTRRRLAA